MIAIEIILVLVLLSSSILVNLKTAFTKLGMVEIDKEFQKYRTYYSVFLWLRKIPHLSIWENLIEFLNIQVQVYRFILAFFLSFEIIFFLGQDLSFLLILVISLSFVALILGLELLMRIFAIAFPLYSVKLFSIIGEIGIIILFLPTYPILLLQEKFSSKQEIKQKVSSSSKFKTKLQEFIYNLDVRKTISSQERKFLESIANFRDRLAKEIMVPRMDVFSLSHKKPILDCAKEFINEGYSRIPIYEDSVDNIIGVVLSKDILDYMLKHTENPELYPTEKPIKSLIKPVLFCPETKKISNLLQEFKSSQIHISIVVDEYGGTEGIITIEDILEELVGEIEDEYDIEEPHPYPKDSSGGYIIDAKTTLIELENDLAIQIPHSSAYDTLSGYIVHVAGSIPKKGWKIHHDNFYIETLSCDEKSIHKVKLLPRTTNDEG